MLKPTFTAIVLAASAVLPAQLTPPTVAKGAAPAGDVRTMSNNQNTLASLADGSIVTLTYKQTSNTAGGHLRLGVTTDQGKNWRFHALPHNTAHRMHDPESGVLCASLRCDELHVAWSDRSVGGTYHSAWYQRFSTKTRTWIGSPVLVAKADASKQQPVQVRDITTTRLDTVALAVQVGANGGLGMGAHEGALYVRKRGQSRFLGPYKMRPGGDLWSREASIVAIEEVVHCAFKNQKGSGGIAYRSFDTTTARWRESIAVPVGPNHNGTTRIDGINAGHKAVITADTAGGLYVMYCTGSAGGLKNNNRLRMAYAAAGKGAKNSDWKDLDIVPHTATVGKNPRGVGKGHPSYPAIQGGDTASTWYTLAPMYQGAVIAIYAKPWEDFQNKYIQIWQHGINIALPTKEIAFWPDTEPYVFERVGAMRSTYSVGHAAWIVYGKNDKPKAGQAPNGWIRLWAATYSTGRTVTFGTGCRGRLPQVPRIHGNYTFAQLSWPYRVECERFPARASFFLAMGTKCQTIDLASMGMTGCELNIDFPVIVPLVVDVNGRLRLTWNVPNDNKLIGQSFVAQAFVNAPIANPGLAVTSNALKIIISN